MKARNTRRVLISNGTVVRPRRLGHAISGVVMTAGDRTAIMKAIRDGDKD